MTILPLRLTADPSLVVIRPLHLDWQMPEGAPSRTRRIVEAILLMSEQEVNQYLAHIMNGFEARHWQTRRIFMTRFVQIAGLLRLDDRMIGDERRQLIGAYFCQEYSYAAAALMNPSVVPHPDQSGVSPGHMRIILSLRTVGEGHLSFIAFREGIAHDSGELQLMPHPPFAVAADASGLEEEEPVGPVTLHRRRDATLSGTVIFPVTAAQANGLEDLRLLCFTHDDGSREWLGTYTAYNRRDVQSELLRTTDFRSFQLCPMTGSAARSKGMALFPRKINGRYMMIGRQDGENLYLIRSASLIDWEGGKRILTPVYPWELMQNEATLHRSRADSGVTSMPYAQRSPCPGARACLRENQQTQAHKALNVWARRA